MQKQLLLATSFLLTFYSISVAQFSQNALTIDGNFNLNRKIDLSHGASDAQNTFHFNPTLYKMVNKHLQVGGSFGSTFWKYRGCDGWCYPNATTNGLGLTARYYFNPQSKLKIYVLADVSQTWSRVKTPKSFTFNETQARVGIGALAMLNEQVAIDANFVYNYEYFKTNMYKGAIRKWQFNAALTNFTDFKLLKNTSEATPRYLSKGRIALTNFGLNFTNYKRRYSYDLGFNTLSIKGKFDYFFSQYVSVGGQLQNAYYLRATYPGEYELVLGVHVNGYLPISKRLFAYGELGYQYFDSNYWYIPFQNLYYDPSILNRYVNNYSGMPKFSSVQSNVGLMYFLSPNLALKAQILSTQRALPSPRQNLIFGPKISLTTFIK